MSVATRRAVYAISEAVIFPANKKRGGSLQQLRCKAELQINLVSEKLCFALNDG